MSIRMLLATLLTASLASPLMAQGQLQPFKPGSGGDGGDGSGDQVKVRAMADVAQITPGKTFNIAVIFEIQPKWHIYWKNPGEGAAAPEVELTLPEGYTAGEIRWPRPKVITDSLGESYGYEDQAILFVPVTPPDGIGEGVAMVMVSANWAVCNDERCVMGSKSLTLTVSGMKDPLAPDAKSGKTAHPMLEKYRKRLPEELNKVENAAASVKGLDLTITGPARGFKEIGFIPHLTPGVNYGKPSVAFDQDRFTMTISLQVKPGNSLGRSLTAGGLVVYGSKLDDPSLEFSIPVDAPEDPSKP